MLNGLFSSLSETKAQGSDIIPRVPFGVIGVNNFTKLYERRKMEGGGGVLKIKRERSMIYGKTEGKFYFLFSPGRKRERVSENFTYKTSRSFIFFFF